MKGLIRRSSATCVGKRIAVALAAACFLGAFASGVASAAEQAPTLTVTYNATDLATEQGTHALYERIVRAAKSVCPEYDSQDLDTAEASWACQRRAVADAVRQIASPRLAAIQALHRGHG